MKIELNDVMQYIEQKIYENKWKVYCSLILLFVQMTTQHSLVVKSLGAMVLLPHLDAIATTH